ncbi:Rne/Rng family ribonuclease [Neobacillus sp. D3-1R]|uniref:Rne/Rng family ribonuclease n=1 Tax=Neobacillus sp. D3-1R TaxID=3445778 RepID=UPI003F9FD737
MAEIIVNYATTEKRYALVENKKIAKLYIEQPLQRSLVGNIYLGTVTKVLPGMHAVFVEIGEEKQGFLHRDKLVSYLRSEETMEAKQQKTISSYVHQGERILVQVEKDATGTKGPRLTGIVEFQGENIIYMPQGGFVATSQKMADPKRRNELKAYGETLMEQHEGIIFRTSSASASLEEIDSELNILRAEYRQLEKSALSVKGTCLLFEKDLFLAQLSNDINDVHTGAIWVDDVGLKQKLETTLERKGKSEHISLNYYKGKENIFSDKGLNHELEKAIKRLVWLDNGSYIVIDETEALTTIDVNSGKYVGKSSRQHTVNQVNVDAAVEVARQIILRDLGGMILIDFIDMKYDSERQNVVNILTNELIKDAKKPKIIGFTELGILQLTRRKTKPSLSETLLTKCPTCNGSGRVYSSESIAFRLERELWEYRQSDYESIFITTTEDVYRLFSDENIVHKERLEDTIGVKIHFTIVDKAAAFYEITRLE